MSASALICLAPGSEETEAVTTIDLLVRGGVKVTTASVASDGSLTIVCSRGVKLLADAPLVEVADGDFDIIVLPGGIKGAECFRDSTLLVETVRQFHLSGRIVAAICAARRPCWYPIICSDRQHDRFSGAEGTYPRRAVAG